MHGAHNNNRADGQSEHVTGVLCCRATRAYTCRSVAIGGRVAKTFGGVFCAFLSSWGWPTVRPPGRLLAVRL